MTRQLLGTALFTMALGLFQTTTVSAQTSYMPQVGDKVEYDGAMYEVTGANLISNSEFNNGLEGWLGGDGNQVTESNFEIEAAGGPDGSPCIHALGSGGSGSAASLKNGWAVETGKTYLFSCWAWRSAEGMKSNTQYSYLCYSDAATTASDKNKYGSINFTADKWTQTQIVFTATAPYAVANLAWLNKSSFDCFSLVEVKVSADLATTKLKETIMEAKARLAGTEVGEEYWQVPESAAKELEVAIAKAQVVLETATEQAAVDEAVANLLMAIEVFKNAYNSLPDYTQGQAYTIAHYSGNLLTATDGEATITALEETVADNQKMTFTKVDYEGLSDVYTIQSVSDKTYLSHDGKDKWSTAWKSEATENSYVQLVRLEGKYLGLKFVVNKYLGSDNTDSGSKLYSDKTGPDNTKAYFLIDKVAVSTAINEVKGAQTVNTSVYTTDGRLVGNDTAKLGRGIYVVRTTQANGTSTTSKVVVR